MNRQTSLSVTVKIARISVLIVLLASIRCIAEVFRLYYAYPDAFAYKTIQPFLMGAIGSASAGLIMVVLLFYRLHKLVAIMGIATVLSLLAIKYFFHLYP